MRKGQILMMLVLLVAFYFIQHRATPTLPMPTAYTQAGKLLKIPFTSTVQKGGQEFWTLARRSGSTYVVNAYNNYRVVHQFPAVKPSSAIPGTTYTTTGNIRIDTVLYQAQYIHINTDGMTGYIQLSMVNTEQTNGNAAGLANTTNSATAP